MDEQRLKKHTCYMHLAWVSRGFAQKRPKKMRVCGCGGTKNVAGVPNKRGGHNFSKKFPRGGPSYSAHRSNAFCYIKCIMHFKFGPKPRDASITPRGGSFKLL